VAVVTKFVPMDRDVLFSGAGLSEQEMATAFAAFARNEIEAAERQNEAALGRAVAHETAVDGVRGAGLAQIKARSIVVATFDLGADVVTWTYQEAVKHAPVLSGAFRRSIRVYEDGTEVSGPDAVSPSADEVVITSVAPYARKLEGGAGKKYMSAQASDGVFEAVAALAAKRYGGQAKIRFSYRSPTGGASGLERWARGNAAKRDGNAAQRRQYQRNTRQPAIIIRFR